MYNWELKLNFNEIEISLVFELAASTAAGAASTSTAFMEIKDASPTRFHPDLTLSTGASFLLGDEVASVAISLGVPPQPGQGGGEGSVHHTGVGRGITCVGRHDDGFLWSVVLVVNHAS